MSTRTLFVKPRTIHTIVRYPDQPDKVLASTGCEVPDTTYWRRRLKKGDVVLANSKDTASAKPKGRKE